MCSEAQHPGRQVWDELSQGSLLVLCCSNSSSVEVGEVQRIFLAGILSASSLGSAGSLWLIAIGTSGFVFMGKPVPVKFFQMAIPPLVI